MRPTFTGSARSSLGLDPAVLATLSSSLRRASPLRRLPSMRSAQEPHARSFADPWSGDVTLWSVLEQLRSLLAEPGAARALSDAAASSDFVPRVCLDRLESLARIDGREREAVLRTAFEAFERLAAAIPAAKQRASRTDVLPDALGGVPTRRSLAARGLEAAPRTAEGWDGLVFADGERAWRPLYLFVGARADTSGAGATLSALLMEAWAHAAVACPARGPLAACFVLEEAHSLGRLPSVLEAMDCARSRRRFFLITGHSVAALEAPYEREERVALAGACGVDVVLVENDLGEIEGRGFAVDDCAVMDRDRHLLVARASPPKSRFAAAACPGGRGASSRGVRGMRGSPARVLWAWLLRPRLRRERGAPAHSDQRRGRSMVRSSSIRSCSFACGVRPGVALLPQVVQVDHELAGSAFVLASCVCRRLRVQRPFGAALLRISVWRSYRGA